MTRSRLGWLGPAIVAVGVAAAGLGSWYMVHARPEPGTVIDTIAIDEQQTVVVRAEAGGDRAFIELHDKDALRWRALVPRYGGRAGAPGIAWSPIAISVRVIRGGRAELFALARRDASKLASFQLAPERGEVTEATAGPVTLSDQVRSYEIVAGPGWNQLIAFDLTTGRGAWSQELGATPVRAGGLDRGQVWIDQGSGPRRFDVRTGAPAPAAAAHQM